MKETVKNVVRFVAPPLVTTLPIVKWPGWLGRTLGVKVPQSVKKQPLGPTGAANINILCEMIDRTKHLDGDIVDCGVFFGGSTIGMGLYLRQHRIEKVIYGFDSFEGFDPERAARDMQLGGEENEDRHLHGFSATSYEKVKHKVNRFGLQKKVEMIKGYFCDSFPKLSPTLHVCFAHLDVNLYESYKECLEFFYDRMVPGGIVLFDEYNDPPWPGCNKAVDEFLVGKPERLEMIERDNHQKWYFVKNQRLAGAIEVS
jgi:predicted O-methyltransferase YrrM